jgi:hypothetical protein
VYFSARSQQQTAFLFPAFFSDSLFFKCHLKQWRRKKFRFCLGVTSFQRHYTKKPFVETAGTVGNGG